MPAVVEVVVPTRDRPAALLRCLEELSAQAFSDFRVIVVDDGGRSPVESALPEELVRGLDLIAVRNDRAAGAAGARNRGVAAGEAEYLAFIDDDVCAHPQLLARHHATVSGGDGPIAAIGPLVPPPGWTPSPWTRWEADRLARGYRRMALGEHGPTWRQFHTGNAMLRRSDLLAAGGFDERFARGEDIELGLRLQARGCEFHFDPGAVGWHYAERSLGEWIEIPKSYARTDALIDALHPGADWLPTVREELGARNWLLRAARRAFCRGPVRRPAVRLATGAGRGLHRAHLPALSMAALSLAYDLEYNAALAGEIAARQPLAE